ncbi:dipeptide ABC transporter ATP-binding protein [bacterium]|nr:dipeptide ABC transporter ATP-binding protein [bacterium]
MNSLLKIENLTKYYPVRKGVFGKISGHVRAVDGVSFDLFRGETFGLVGESGCGKTTIGRCILRLTTPTSGKIFFQGSDMSSLSAGELRKIRRDIQIIFQDPYASLNPRMKIGAIIEEGLVINGWKDRHARRERVVYLMDRVGLGSEHILRFPHEFSGGQRQRIGIARALALNPELVVCDEPVSALDVSVRAQVINLLDDLQEEFGLTYLFIAHDLSIVQHFSNRVAVMYLGKIMESGSAQDLFRFPAHPYTQALLSAVPIPDPTIKKERILLDGDVPTPVNPPSGCRFHTRCPIGRTKAVCMNQEPKFSEVSPGHFSACHFSFIS